MWNDEGINYGMGTMGDGGWHWIMGFHGILSLIFLGIIIVGMILLVRDLRQYGPENVSNNTPIAKRHHGDSGQKVAPSRGNNIGPGRHA